MCGSARSRCTGSGWTPCATVDGPRSTWSGPRVPIRPLSEPGRYWLLVRRSLTDGELSHYLCFCPPESSLADLVAVAGARWAIEESFHTANGEVGLDHYQVRSWRAWYAHITLSMLALAWLAASKTLAAKGDSQTPPKT